MKARIKSVDTGSDIGVFEYIPERSDCFRLWLTFTIGKYDSEGGDCFRLQVCTPDWLAENTSDMTWGRHMLIVDSYRPLEIVNFVDAYISSLRAADWVSLAGKIARVMEWEFEDY